jgi:hypothetical protein
MFFIATFLRPTRPEVAQMTIALRRGRGGPSFKQLVDAEWHDRLSFHHERWRGHGLDWGTAFPPPLLYR